jgi:hypothetical protein
VRDQVSHPYKTTGKFMVLYLLSLRLKPVEKHIWGCWGVNQTVAPKME